MLDIAPAKVRLFDYDPAYAIRYRCAHHDLPRPRRD
jgi:hypothetical protein